MDWVRLAQLGGSSESFCEQSSEPARSLKGEEFLDGIDEL